MSKFRSVHWLAASAIALSAFAAPALAQSVKDDSYYDDEITIVAPGVHRDRTGERSSSGIPIEELTLQRVVDTHDLDLRRDSHVEELYRRIDYSVREACDEIERVSHVPITSDRECIREATRDAMAQADALIYARRG